MSSARSSKLHDIDWKLREVIDLIKMYLDDNKIEHLTSAEYDLRVLVDGLVNRYDPRDPPF